MNSSSESVTSENPDVARASLLDTLIGGLDQTLRQIHGVQRQATRPTPDEAINNETAPTVPVDDTGSDSDTSEQVVKRLSDHEQELSGRLMRINHAGEIAAQALYRGQALASRDQNVRRQMEQAAAEETDHLVWCEQRLDELNTSTSVLNPLWYVGSFAIGYAAGRAGDDWSLGFVGETEKQVEKHLDQHLERLPANDQRSRLIIQTMKEDEARHGQAAMDAGGRELPAVVRGLMRLTSKVMTRTAYWL